MPALFTTRVGHTEALEHGIDGLRVGRGADMGLGSVDHGRGVEHSGRHVEHQHPSTVGGRRPRHLEADPCGRSGYEHGPDHCDSLHDHRLASSRNVACAMWQP